MSDERGEMTPQELDELASAYLDGETTAEEAALVESDPHLLARVEELRAVRDLVAAPVELASDKVRDQMIAQALDHRAPVESLEKARRRLRAMPSQARVILAAAAVVAAIALIGVTIFERQGDEFADDDMASAPTMADAAAAAEPEAPAPAAAAEPEAPAPAAAAEPESAEAAEDSAPMDDADDFEAVFAAEAPAEETMDEEEEVPLVFDTQEVLENYAMQFVDDLADAQSSDSDEPLDQAFWPDESIFDAQSSDSDEPLDQADGLACPLFTEEEVKLLVRFRAVVEGIELEVSIYTIYTGAELAQQELLLVQTSPPPDCAIQGPVRAMAWSTSP